jgi:CheY-like chemotaxis protein/HPt (histidine-containing phosphotransfer) domain-containing protein
MAEIELAADGPDVIPIGPPRRFVFYSHDDEPVDRNATNHTIVTTALSRARIVTAVAVAAGRKSPETEAFRPLPQLASHGAAPSRDQAISEGRLILLAEDHPVNRDVILRQLRLLGYAVDAVEDGVAALAALARTRYALLLTDCSMPEMDGFELTRRIRLAETDGERLPIVALTANALDGEDQRCFATGMDDYLAKPVEMATLRARLEHWLPPGARGPAQPAAAATTLAADDAGAAPALNLTVLAEYCGDDPVAIGESLKLFVDTMKTDLKRLSAAIAQNNAEEAQLFAHRMKGAARIVGGYRLATCSEAVELSAGARDWPAIERDMPRLLEATAQINQMYDEMESA